MTTAVSERGERSEEFAKKKLASRLAREVLEVWGQVGRVVQFKHEQRVEKAKQEARNKHLDFLVGQARELLRMPPADRHDGALCREALRYDLTHIALACRAQHIGHLAC